MSLYRIQLLKIAAWTCRPRDKKVTGGREVAPPNPTLFETQPHRTLSGLPKLQLRLWAEANVLKEKQPHA